MKKCDIMNCVKVAIGQPFVSDTSNDYDYGRQLVKDMFLDFYLSHGLHNKKEDLSASLKARYQHLMKINISYQMHLGIVDELKRYDFINSL